MKISYSLIIFLLGILNQSAHSAAESALSEKLAEIRKSPEGLVPLGKGYGSPLLIIHGIDFAPYPEEWIRPFDELMRSGRNAYLHKWEPRKGLEKHRDLFLKSIQKLLKKYPREKITIFGFSAGGAISLLALDKLSGTPLIDRIFLHTVASPFFGFEAPARAYMGAPFVGRGKIEMGIGAIKFMKNKSFNNCHHWINTNCVLDSTSCDRKKINPQRGPLSGSSEMPCGNNNMTLIDDETHTSIIMRVLKEI